VMRWPRSRAIMSTAPPAGRAPPAYRPRRIDLLRKDKIHADSNNKTLGKPAFASFQSCSFVRRIKDCVQSVQSAASPVAMKEPFSHVISCPAIWVGITLRNTEYHSVACPLRQAVHPQG
jgi:hypothetical protein